jgi:putative addiction module component (TIGR02574 family)
MSDALIGDADRVWEAEWAVELERRSTEVAEGRVQSIPWETVNARLLKKLEQLREGRTSS